MLGAGGRGAVEVNIEKILNVALRRSAGTVGCCGGCDGVLRKVLALFLDGSTLDLVRAVAALADERLWRLMVDGRKG